MLADTSLDYPLGKDVYLQIKEVRAKTISADFDEVLKLSDRILVMFEGQVMGIYSGENPPVEEISLAMAGKEE